MKSFRRKWFRELAVERKQGGGGIGRSAAETRAMRDTFFQVDVVGECLAGFFGECFRRFYNEVSAVCGQ